LRKPFGLTEDVAELHREGMASMEKQAAEIAATPSAFKSELGFPSRS
jgi:hypothetical protein